MLNFILSAFLSLSSTCTGECKNKSLLSIDFSATVASSSTLAMDIQPTNIAGLYKLDIEYNLYHTEHAGQYTESYLVIDNHNVLVKNQIEISLLENNIEMDIPLFVIAVAWPHGMTEKQVMALYKIDKKKRKKVV